MDEFCGYEGYIAAVAQYPDQAETLRQAGAHAAFNIYAEAGTGFAAHIDDEIQKLLGNPPPAAPSAPKGQGQP